MTVSEEYQAQLRGLHATPGWGSSAGIPEMAQRCIAQFAPASVLDFGCGKGNVTRSLRARYPGIAVSGYDPMDPATSLPEEVDMVFSKDVLEHVEPERLEAVLSDLWRRTRKVQYHLIACHKAIHYLPDGRNAHLIIETADWWQRLFRAMGFRILDEEVLGEIKRPRGRESLATTKYQCVLGMA
jgi:SAM-dependent methyltransferase